MSGSSAAGWRWATAWSDLEGDSYAVDLPRLHLITDDRVAARADFISLAGTLLAAGGARMALHLRMPGGSGRQIHDRAVQLMPAARAAGAWLMINDRVDVALAVGATGVQCGARSVAPEAVRRLVGDGGRVGVSVHHAWEAMEAREAGADFVLAGTIYPSASHPGRPGAGLDHLSEVVVQGVPTVAIGGITLERVAAVLARGAAGVAVIRAIWDAEQPREALLRFIDELYP